MVSTKDPPENKRLTQDEREGIEKNFNANENEKQVE